MSAREKIEEDKRGRPDLCAHQDSDLVLLPDRPAHYPKPRNNESIGRLVGIDVENASAHVLRRIKWIRLNVTTAQEDGNLRENRSSSFCRRNRHGGMNVIRTERETLMYT